MKLLLIHRYKYSLLLSSLHHPHQNPKFPELQHHHSLTVTMKAPTPITILLTLILTTLTAAAPQHGSFSTDLALRFPCPPTPVPGGVVDRNIARTISPCLGVPTPGPVRRLVGNVVEEAPVKRDGEAMIQLCAVSPSITCELFQDMEVELWVV